MKKRVTIKNNKWWVGECREWDIFTSLHSPRLEGNSWFCSLRETDENLLCAGPLLGVAAEISSNSQLCAGWFPIYRRINRGPNGLLHLLGRGARTWTQAVWLQTSHHSPFTWSPLVIPPECSAWGNSQSQALSHPLAFAQAGFSAWNTPHHLANSFSPQFRCHFFKRSSLPKNL